MNCMALQRWSQLPLIFSNTVNISDFDCIYRKVHEEDHFNLQSRMSRIHLPDTNFSAATSSCTGQMGSGGRPEVEA